MSESSLNPDKKLSTLTLVNDHKLSMHLNSISEHVSPSDRVRWDNASSGTSSARHAASAKRSAEAAAASAAKAEEIANNITIPDNSNLSEGINVLPLGTQTSLGAPAYGLSVQKDTGLQLWGTHFYVGDVHNDHTLKVMHDSLSLGTTNSAAIGFDYANEVIFRTMPNDGSSANDNAGAIYRFEAWQWADDSHTSKKEMPVDIRKTNAGTLCDESVLNKAEVVDTVSSLKTSQVTKDSSDLITSGGVYDKIYSIRTASYLNKNDDNMYVPANISNYYIGGSGARVANNGVAIGYKAASDMSLAADPQPSRNSTSIGASAYAHGYWTNGDSSSGNCQGAVAVGYEAYAPKAGIAIGHKAYAYGNHSIAIGTLRNEGAAKWRTEAQRKLFNYNW